MRIEVYSDDEYMLPLKTIFVQINPENYTITKNVEYSDTQALGTSNQSLKFNKIGSEEVSFVFIFDSSGVVPPAKIKDGKVTNIIFPDNIYKLKNVKTISLKGDFYWNYNNFINSISKLPKLENLSLIYNSFPNKIFQNPNFYKLKHLKGLSYSGSNKVIFPEFIKNFNSLTSLSLSFDSDENSMIEINKFSSLQNLKFLDLRWVTLNNKILTNFKKLKELSLSSVEIKNSDDFFLSIAKIKPLESLTLLNNKLSITSDIAILKQLNCLREFYAT